MLRPKTKIRPKTEYDLKRECWSKIWEMAVAICDTRGIRNKTGIGTNNIWSVISPYAKLLGMNERAPITDNSLTELRALQTILHYRLRDAYETKAFPGAWNWVKDKYNHGPKE